MGGRGSLCFFTFPLTLFAKCFSRFFSDLTGVVSFVSGSCLYTVEGTWFVASTGSSLVFSALASSNFFREGASFGSSTSVRETETESFPL